ncbi:uncharacterized protein BcabD6B2_19420 [Babesia caballi]|uniref:Uncharacterized protein n=1 Tax=Babesia caballi TaxID=5871 RepID=A0AAV4LRU2_BABCB|nr:hypothetical protein, conserved [Babesia caballi]
MGKLLKDPPTTLKEAIDWLALVGDAYGPNNWSAKGKYDELERALKGLHGFEAYTNGKFGKSYDFGGHIKRVAERLGSKFLGYSGQGVQSFNGSGIVPSNGSYVSTYRDAEWQEQDKSEYVSIFLAAAPFVFWSLAYLYLRCKDSRGWYTETLDSSISGIGSFMLKMGFTPTQLRNVNGSTVANVLDSGGTYAFTELNTTFRSSSYSHYSSSDYSKFIEGLQRPFQSDAIDRPLACSYLLSKYYCEYLKQQQQETTETFTKIREKLEKFKTSWYNSDQDIKDQINTFISTCLTKPKKSNDPSPSSSGPIAGTLTTLGLGGGATAAYIFNIGGAKTIVNGLLKIG